MSFQNQFVLFFITILFIEIIASDTDDFICTDGTRINLNNICDGVANCEDQSDENKELCYHIICPKGMFRCYYGACIDKSKRCNDETDCIDKSDESQCGREKGSCNTNEFRCKSGNCVSIDNMCDGTEHCDDGSDETQLLCEEPPCPEGAFHCKHGGCIHTESQCNGYSDCIDGSDESEVLCEYFKCKGDKCNSLYCPPINLSRINAICQSKSGVIACDGEIPAGTRVEYECKEYFVPIDKKHVLNKHAECQMDGTWNKELLKCEPDCGTTDTNEVALVVKGWDTEKKIYPWHATMYVLENDKWEFWCGGTLITEKIVLTAAHCTWQLSNENIKIVLGKYYNPIDKEETHVEAQERNINEVISQPLYQDRNGNFGSDLAMLILNDSVVLSSKIKPACIDWNLRDLKHHLKENSTGLIVGMGINENETFSDTLRGVYLPVVSNEKCVKEQDRDFKKFVTYTVFCAGWRNGTGVCNGDSGGGLVFPKVNDKSRWVLQGVVSISPRRRGTSFCDPSYFTVFTKVAMYLDWLRETINRIHL